MQLFIINLLPVQNQMDFHWVCWPSVADKRAGLEMLTNLNLKYYLCHIFV